MRKRAMKQLIFSILLFSSTAIISAQKTALIFGVTGQDGSYLAELLLEKGYVVHGVKRRTSVINTILIDHLYQGPAAKDRTFVMHYGDLSDSANIMHLVQTIQPDEIYNLAAQSHVQVSFELPEYTGNIDALGVLRILEAIRVCGLAHKTRFYQASTSEMFGGMGNDPQSENTPFYPRSPYGVAKLYGYWITKNYRESYGMFACNGILFNHESSRRGETFVTRKIVRAAVAIKHGVQSCLYLGNLDASRDWGHAKDYVYAMWLMLQQEKPDDFVIGTGNTHTVREFVEKTFAQLGISFAWKGTGLEEVGYDLETGVVLVRIDPRYFRPAEVDYLCANPTKAVMQLGWQQQYTFESLIHEMIEVEEENFGRNTRGIL